MAWWSLLECLVIAMLISIGSKIIEGPWGGGNLFVKNLSAFLTLNGHKVIFDLSEPNIDLILLTDPRSRKESSSSFNHLEIKKYKEHVNNNVKVVQRINECDERKGTKNINNFYLKASDYADHVVFVSSWLEKIYHELGMKKEKTSVILSGSNTAIFNDEKSAIYTGKEPLKLFTHHWSSHRNKGFEIYKLIDDLINSERWNNKLEFTYVGNVSEEYEFFNSDIKKPLAGIELAKEIKKHHIYVTASINEPSGNHHIEAAQCGLPILYLDSGGIPEYCNGFGISFINDFENKLEEIIDSYDTLKEKLKNYPFNSNKMCEEYLDLFQNLLETNDNLSNVNSNYSLRGRLLILKNKFLRIFRDQLYLNIKNKLANFYRDRIKTYD